MAQQVEAVLDLGVDPGEPFRVGEPGQNLGLIAPDDLFVVGPRGTRRT
jgi:hypothetical protein